MLTIGVVTYLVGLFNSAMEFNELGYYFTVLLLGLYGAFSLQKTAATELREAPQQPCTTALLGLW